MKAAVESKHGMELRKNKPRRDASKETPENEKELFTSHQDNVLEANLCDGYENKIVAEDQADLKSPLSPNVPLDRRAIALIVVSTIVILGFSIVIFSDCGSEHSVSKCKDSLDELYQLYPEHDTLWKAINTSFKMCTKGVPPRPGVILVLHNGNGSIAECLVNHTATLISQLLGVSDTGEYCLVDGRKAHQLYEKDKFLTEIMNRRKDLGVVVLSHIGQLDLELVRNLHFICDTDPNISDKAVIILMLEVETQNFIGQNLDDLAAEKLAELWKEELDVENRFDAIVGRITINIASIDENIKTKCP